MDSKASNTYEDKTGHLIATTGPGSSGGSSSSCSTSTVVNGSTGHNSLVAVAPSTPTPTTTTSSSSSAAAAMTTSNSSSSIELCLVCGDRASGRHYGAISCEGCKGFFKRSIRKQLGYQCRGTMNCEVTKHHRNRCQFCRLQKCLASGMRSDSVQHERKPIVDKKEHHLTANNSMSSVVGSTNCSSGSGAGNGGTTNSIYHHHHHHHHSSASTTTSAPHHHNHHRSKLFGGGHSTTASSSSSSLNGSGTGNVTAAGVAVAAAAAAAAAASAASSSSDNLGGNGVFPVGFNFADLTQTLLLAATPYQSQQQPLKHEMMSHSSYNVYSPSGILQGGVAGDDDSLDNSITGDGNTSLGLSDSIQRQQTPPTSSATATAAAVNLIQSSIEKNLINESLEMIASIQQQYDHHHHHHQNRSNISINNNNLQCNTTIVKEELILDDHNESMHHVADDSRPNSVMGGLVGGGTVDCDMNDDEQQSPGSSGGGGISVASSSIIAGGTFDGPLLTESNIPFSLQTPTLVPSYLNLHYVCESGSRLLFLSVYWMKRVRSFQQLSDNLKNQLIKRHWVELFAVGLAQCSHSLSIATIMSTLVTNILQFSELDKINQNVGGGSVNVNGGVGNQCPGQAHKILKLTEHAFQLNEFVQSVQGMSLDDHEYAYIRLIVTFSPDSLNIKDQSQRALLEKLQFYALNCMRNHLSANKCPDVNERCNKILLRLMQLRSLESSLIEELFFSNLIGHVQIEYMIPYILKLGGCGDGAASA